MSAPHPTSRRRAYWLKTLHEWHWVSSALCLMGMLLFTVTGITLNHAGQIEAKPAVTHRKATLAAPLITQLEGHQSEAKARGGKLELPAGLRAWLRSQWGIDSEKREAEWSDDEVYLSLPRPGGDAWLRVSLPEGAMEYERTDRGWISYLNDLHKGRNTGAVWRWLIDIFAAAALVFCVSGFFILKMHAGQRAFTWPMVGAGLVLPLLLALLFIH